MQHGYPSGGSCPLAAHFDHRGHDEPGVNLLVGNTSIDQRRALAGRGQVLNVSATLSDHQDFYDLVVVASSALAKGARSGWATDVPIELSSPGRRWPAPGPGWVGLS